MLKYLAKISMDIFPSVLATIIGAYIVNHYINARPAPDVPVAAVAPAQTGKNAKPADVANLPSPGVKAKGISEKTVMDKPAAEKAADKSADQSSETKTSDTKASETKAADLAPAETAPHGRPSSREKAVAKSTPAPTPAAAPTVEANSAPAAGTTAPTTDANDLVRAAVERLRKSPESKSAESKSLETKSAEKTSQPVVQETARANEAGPRFQDTPRIVTEAPSAVRPLPPPITVSTPATEVYGNGASSPANPPYTASIGNDDPNRLTPPADIPVPVIAPPLDLRADAGASVQRPKANVADEMLSGVKSIFHAVLPKTGTPD